MHLYCFPVWCLVNILILVSLGQYVDNKGSNNFLLHKLIDANWVNGGHFPNKTQFFCSAHFLCFWVCSSA